VEAPFRYFGRELGYNFLSIGQLWLSNKKFLVCNVFSAAALWGVLETKKCYLFSGNKSEGYESFTLENCNNASKLEYPMPTTDEMRVHDKTGGTETCSNKPD